MKFINPFQKAFISGIVGTSERVSRICSSVSVANRGINRSTLLNDSAQLISLKTNLKISRMSRDGFSSVSAKTLGGAAADMAAIGGAGGGNGSAVN